MQRLFLGVVTVASTVALLFCMAGCGGGGGNKIDAAEKRIAELSSLGVPDDSLSGLRVFLYNVRSLSKSGNSGEVRINTDSLLLGVTRLDAWYASSVASAKMKTDSLKQLIVVAQAELTGQQKSVLDSALIIIDSLVAKTWFVQAELKCQETVSMLDQLKIDESKSAEVMKKIIGTWKGANKLEGDGFSAIESKNITFKADGSFTLDEAVKGQTQMSLKEDWQFISSGTWTLKGDTALLAITHEKCARQNFENLMVKDGKERWVKKESPTYDSTITNGSRNKFLTWDYISKELKKK